MKSILLLCALFISAFAQDSPFPTSIKDMQDQVNGVIKSTGDLAQQGVNGLGGLATDVMNIPGNLANQGQAPNPAPAPAPGQ